MSVLERLERDGFAVVHDFFKDEELEEMKREITEIVEGTDFEAHPKSVFSTLDEDKHAADEYFLNSSDKVRVFFEEGAVDEEKRLKVDRHRALNKIGHGLHFLSPVFHRHTFNSKMKKLFRELRFEQPEIVQSMYIFKQPLIGGAVLPHVDCTFLRANPISHLVGLWAAVDEASIENGCLWFIPGSHKTPPTDYRFVRTHDTSGGPLLKFIGEKPVYDDAKFVPVPIPKGSIILIDGRVVHKSEGNTSDRSRHAYTIHVLEKKDTEWSKENWLQETPTYNFKNLYEEGGNQ